MDLKIKDVADLLNVSESTIRRWLLERRIPAYRLNHQYRFNRSEIEDWVLRHKVAHGLSLSAEPKERRVPTARGSKQFGLYRAVHKGGIHHDIGGDNKEGVIGEAMRQMADEFDLDAEVLTDLLLDRERMMPTALGSGIGVPHTRDFLLPTANDLVKVVFLKKPIEYGALDSKPVHTLFFLFACEDKRHLHLLAKLAHFTSDSKTPEFLAKRPSADALLERIKTWEGRLAKPSDQ